MAVRDSPTLVSTFNRTSWQAQVFLWLIGGSHKKKTKKHVPGEAVLGSQHCHLTLTCKLLLRSRARDLGKKKEEKDKAPLLHPRNFQSLKSFPVFFFEGSSHRNRRASLSEF